jgi:hypothetical protein
MGGGEMAGLPHRADHREIGTLENSLIRFFIISMKLLGLNGNCWSRLQSNRITSELTYTVF